MDCKQTNKFIGDYIEGQLSESVETELQKHLNTCDKCFNQYSSLKKTLSLLKPKQEINEQAFYYTRLKQKMENKQSKNFTLYNTIFARQIAQPMLYAASIIIAVFIGIQIGSYSSNNNQLSELTTEEEYIKLFSETQYFNDFEQENIENTIVSNVNEE